MSRSTLSRKMSFNSAQVPSLFLPPVDRSMRELDRSFFRKTIPLTAARITDFKRISPLRDALSKSKALLNIGSIRPVVEVSSDPGAKYLLLRPDVKVDGRNTWSNELQQVVDHDQLQLRPYDLQLQYADWTMQNILDAILPDLPEDEKETPAGYAQVGHVAHVNLRQQYLPYKHLIGQVLLDKSPVIETVINKTLDVGTESAFRTFPYEVIAGRDDLDVIVYESGCEFKFNFGKVYWNSRLGTEHARIVSKFQEGEAVCDVMAGVGPFAIPAGKRKVFVHANDLNPDSYESLKYAIQKNKVSDFVQPYCEDGRAFIRKTTQALAESHRRVPWTPKMKVSRSASPGTSKKKTLAATRIFTEPATFDHYVLNLPATAVEFLDTFKGLYAGREAEFMPQTDRKLPLIHVYLFQAKHENEEQELQEICERVSKHLGARISSADPSSELELFYARLVAPWKKMYCASFRLPAAVAFSTA